MAEAKVSLICTVRNEAGSIGPLLASVAAMERRPDEWIIVDAGSTDGTMELVREAARHHPWIVPISEPGCSIARGRNVAIARAAHPLIAMIDAGCVADPRWLAELLAAKEADPGAALIGGRTAVRAGGRFAAWVAILQPPPGSVDEATFLPSARSVLAEKRLWETVRGFPEELTFAGEDTLFMVRAREAGFRFRHAPSAVVTWQPQRGVVAYLRQLYRYGVGDGEARLHAWHNLKLLLLVAALPAFVAGVLVSWVLAIAGAAFLLLGFARIMGPLRAPGRGRGALLGAYLFFLLSQFPQLAGYVRGLALPRRRARPLVAMAMFGGLDKVPPVLNEGRSLVAAGYDVALLGLRYAASRPDEESVAPGFRLRRVALWSRRIVGDDDRFEVVRYGEMVMRALLWCFRSNADLYVAHDLIALPFVYPAARLRGRPVVYRAHELWPEQAPDFPRAAFWRALDRWFARRVDLLVAPEENRARIYHDEYGAPAPPLLVPNCSRLVPRPGRDRLRALLAARGLTPRLVAWYHGGIGVARRIDNACRALAELPGDVVLVLAGPMEPAFRSWWDAYAPGAGIAGRVVHLGDLPHDELYELCAGADVALAFIDGSCRNNRYNTTATNKLFEYMMCALPVLASEYEGYRAFVEGQGIGRCVDAADPGAIARALRAMGEDGAALRAMGERARALAETRWHWDAVAPALVGAYRRLLEDGR